MASIKRNKFIISVLGYWHVGKTSLISSYFGYDLDENIPPTRALDYYYNTSFNKNYIFKICDTIGGEKYSLLVELQL